MSSRDAVGPARESVLDSVCAGLSLAVPLVVTALRVNPWAQWRDDLALVQSLGLVPFGGQGTPASLLSELFALLPIGGRVLRAGLVGALGAGLAGRASYSIARSLLARNAATPRLAPPLALAAALTATLSPSFQHEGTAAGGATLAVALGLAALNASQRIRTKDIGDALMAGALLGLTFSENRVTATVVLVAITASAVARSALPSPRSLVVAAAATITTVGFCLVPLFVRPFAEHAWVTLGVDGFTQLGNNIAEPQARLGPFGAWSLDMGPVAAMLGLGGLAWGLVRGPTRPGTAALVAMVVADALLPERGPSALAANPLAAAGLLAVAALAMAAVVGVQTAALALERARIPFAAPAAALLVVFQFTLVFAAAESSSNVVMETTSLGADVWTDEALGELPPDATVLVRSKALAWRLLAARVAHGERPDVLVLPLGIAGERTVGSALVREEPAVAPLVRDMAMTGSPSEFALTGLADARPLFVELDPTWNNRLLDHLRPAGLWLAFTAQTLGRSDRASALASDDGRRAFRRVLSAAKLEPGGDVATLAVLEAGAKEQAVLLATLGDRDSARRVLPDVDHIEPHSLFASRLTAELSARSAVHARSLLE